eukprot:6211837-Pleurochrysis_carterae.AAC.3
MPAQACVAVDACAVADTGAPAFKCSWYLAREDNCVRAMGQQAARAMSCVHFCVGVIHALRRSACL